MPATGLFGKILKVLMVGGGSVLSLIPGMKVVGAPLISAGLAITTKTPILTENTTNAITNSVNSLNDAFGASKAQTAAGGISFWLAANKWAYYVGGGLVLLLILIFTGRKRK